ncbi:MAG: PQQ-binding-like beta-propeller repeat protein [Cyanobacteria bacterium SZAS-4]|nr:PQQ-binding-like beta-propeller repeat protein [Cyanobacteria bacterium SZAS-4]
MKRRSSTALLVVLSSLVSLAITSTNSLAIDDKEAAEMRERAELAFLRKPLITADKLVLGNSTLYELDKNSGRLLSKLPLKSPIASDPLMVNGVTYIATEDAIVRAVRNGRELWKTTLPIDQALSAPAPAFIFGEYLLIGSLDHLTCLQRSTGKMHWKLDKARDYSGIELFDGKVYFPDSANRFCAVEPATGKTIWKENGKFRDDGPMLIKDGAIYASHPFDETFCKLDLATGKTLWKKKTATYRFLSKPLISLPNGYVAINCAERNLVIFNCSTGMSYKYDPADHPITAKQSSTTYSLIDSWLMSKGVLYTGGHSGTGTGGCMSAFDPITRKRKWLTVIKDQHRRVTSTPAANPLLNNHQLIFPIATGTVYALQSDTGKKLWTSDTQRESISGDNIFLSKDTVCINDRLGVSGLSANTGKKVWDFNSKPTENCTNAVQDGSRLFVQTSKATAYALDINSGKVIWRFAGEKMSPEAVANEIQKELPPAPFTKEEWINAKKSWFWSRQKMAEQFCQRFRNELDGKKLRRSTVLALLGQPEEGCEERYTKSYRWSDDYHLSARSGTFEIQYDSEGMVSSYQISDREFSLWDRIGPSQPKATVELARKALGTTNIAQIRKILGRPDFFELNISPNFPTPLRYSRYRWNLAKDGRTFLNAHTCGSYDLDPDERSIDSLAIVTLSPDCPVQN